MEKIEGDAYHPLKVVKEQRTTDIRKQKDFASGQGLTGETADKKKIANKLDNSPAPANFKPKEGEKKYAEHKDYAQMFIEWHNKKNGIQEPPDHIDEIHEMYPIYERYNTKYSEIEREFIN